jgi:thiosulfate/3-mercaptopyruvate sulfurtransferase
MTDTRSDHLVTTDWLAEHLDAPDVIILDASWHLPGTDRSGKAEFDEEHIPGASFFDIDDLSDETSHLPHMLPSPIKFSSRMRKMGIGDGKRIVVYDSHGLFSAARVWWMFRVFGHDDVVILDGGLKKWKAEDRPLEDGPPAPAQERHFSARQQSIMVRDADDIRAIIANGKAQIADARSPGRFSGVEKEPRAGLRSGHMPGAVCVHYATLLNEDGTVKPAEEITTVFADAGVDLSAPVVTTCGSGVTAAILTLGLILAGHQDNALYDGSWTEWGGLEDVPVETHD